MHDFWISHLSPSRWQQRLGADGFFFFYVVYYVILCKTLTVNVSWSRKQILSSVWKSVKLHLRQLNCCVKRMGLIAFHVYSIPVVCFEESREDLQSEETPGRPVSVCTPELVEKKPNITDIWIVGTARCWWIQ